MVKNRIPPGQHKHCDKCYNLRCKVPVEISVSCVVIKCPRQCGAAFHLCKEEEHQLLCPNEKVPCLNADHGCPVSMLRGRRAEHLEVCPASVVCCSQEWNRWPVEDGDTAFYRNVPIEPQPLGPLDLSLAFRDQDLLFRSIKMKTVFPELAECVSEDAGLLDAAAGGVSAVDGDLLLSGLAANSGDRMDVTELSQEEREALAKNKDLDSIQKFSSWEGMFKKEMRGCQETSSAVEKSGESSRSKGREGKGSSSPTQGSREVTTRVNSGTGFAPWEDGVLERLSKEVNVAEFNMYVVHNGAMLINFGQLAACTPREKDFVYGSLEPIPVRTERTYNVPVSYRAKRNSMKDPSQKRKTVRAAVDTADLGVAPGELPKSDEVATTLLCSLERELRGHAISESVGTDGFYVDVGTQTYDLATAPFETDASLADVAADRPRALHMQVQAESVTRRHNKSSSVFSFLCGHFFRRDEYHAHFRNVHCDVQSGLNGWFEQRCPLAYLGCNYNQRRFQPSENKGTVAYAQGTFRLRPEVPPSLLEGHTCEPVSPERKRQRNMDPLSRLPNEVLCHMAGFLDSFTLSQLSQVSKLMREVCATLVEERGMVSLTWERKSYSHGGSSWKCRKKVWTFSSLFSPVDRWRFDSDAPSMSEHLKVCPFYQREERTEPVALVGIDEARMTGERQGLINMFCDDN